jgi:formylglycine-generating enzyme required for sulfatase activity
MRRGLALLALAALGGVGGCAATSGGEAPPRAGQAFRDCADCPQMVVVPPGGFVMGAPAGEPVGDPDERPQRAVTIAKAFALGRMELTRGEFARFVAATGHQAARNCSVWTGQRTERVADKDWRDPNFVQTDAHPVTCVSWLDAKAYVAWLSAQTGKTYRLATEAEWEYAARAGATGRYSFGENSAELCAHGNIADIDAREAGGAPQWTYAECRDGFALTTAPVGSFRANAFGLHDMHGNVWEWVEDCHHPDYAGAPVDGSARVSEGCATRVDRGGGFFNNRGTNRAAERALYPPANNSVNIGLRVARDL